MQMDLGSFIANGVVDAKLFVDLMVLDENGDLLLSSAPAERKNFADHEYFLHHQADTRDELLVGKPLIGQPPGKWLIPMTRRISRSDGAFGGVVVISVNPEYFVKFFRRADLGSNSVVNLVGLDGISRARQTGEGQVFGSDLAGSAMLQARAVTPNGNLVTIGQRDNVARFLSYRTLTEYPLVVAVGVSRGEVLASLQIEARAYYSGALMASMVIVLFAFFLVSSLTRQKRGVEALARSEARFRATFDQAAIGVSQTALDGNYLQVNQAFCDMVGYTEAELLSRSYREISHPDDGADSIERRARLMAGNAVPTAVEKRYIHKDGSVIWVAISSSLVRDVDGAPNYFVNMVECITDRKRLQENLERMARHDSLTQLPNRALFYNRLEFALEQARRRDWLTGVMFIDLDRFKTINDTLGHAVGDQLLQQMASRLIKCVRAEDTVGRLGGDEFAVILSELAQEQSAGVVAQKIIETLRKPFQLERHEVFATTSIGIAICRAGEGDADTMLSNADAAMYNAKKLGRNNFQFYAATMSERAMERLLLEKELRYALSRNELLLNFQPMVNLGSGEITGFEALLRWHRTGGEIVSPADFVPVLEECGLIEEVGEWVLRSTCAQLHAWQKAGIKPVPVAVNLSPKQFQHHDIGGMITRALNDFNVDPALLELEITESTAMNNAEGAIAALQNLKALGLRIAIDDFGTGYSSLSYLTRFPIDSLKIDRSFVIDLPDSQEGASIARAVITMAHALRLKVIAEGVENLAQLEFLTDNDCDEIQGYYCSRPLPADQATALLSGTRRLITRPQLVSAAA
jgi:diguanylate cyclase (GGDEF)-like protein/PAS domain S-box-containing protein